MSECPYERKCRDQGYNAFNPKTCDEYKRCAIYHTFDIVLTSFREQYADRLVNCLNCCAKKCINFGKDLECICVKYSRNIAKDNYKVDYNGRISGTNDKPFFYRLVENVLRVALVNEKKGLIVKVEGVK